MLSLITALICEIFIFLSLALHIVVWACVYVRLVFNGPCTLWDFSCLTCALKASLCDVDLMNIKFVVRRLFDDNTYFIVGYYGRQCMVHLSLLLVQ